MKIGINGNDGGRDMNLNLPSGLVLNRLAAWFYPDYLKKYGVSITRKQSAVFIAELNRYRREHPDWVLVEVECVDGTHVVIEL